MAQLEGIDDSMVIEENEDMRVLACSYYDKKQGVSIAGKFTGSVKSDGLDGNGVRGAFVDVLLQHEML